MAVRNEVFGLHKGLAKQYHGEDDANYTERISDGTAECGAAARYVCGDKSLLCGTEGRRIGGGTAEDADHIGDGYARNQTQHEGHDRSEEDDSEAP